MPAKLLDIADANLPLADFIVLDASIALQPNALAVNFLRRLQVAAQRGEAMPILPLLAFEECYFKICQRFLMRASQQAKYPNWKDYYKRHPLELQKAHPDLEKFHASLLAVPIWITEPEDVAIQPRGREPLLSNRIGDLINQFAVLPKDATILSEAERLGIRTVASLDSDWSRATGFTVYTKI